MFGQGALTEKAALLWISPSTFTRMANMIVDELVLRTGEVIRIPDRSMQVFLKCRRTRKPFPGAVFALDGTLQAKSEEITSAVERSLHVSIPS